MKDSELFYSPKNVLFEQEVDTGGMFNEKFHIAFDDDVDHPKRYFSARTSGFGGGSGKRHATYEDAMKWIEYQL